MKPSAPSFEKLQRRLARKIIRRAPQAIALMQRELLARQTERMRAVVQLGAELKPAA